MLSLLESARPMMEAKCCHFDWCVGHSHGFRNLRSCGEELPQTGSMSARLTSLNRIA